MCHSSGGTGPADLLDQYLADYTRMFTVELDETDPVPSASLGVWLIQKYPSYPGQVAASQLI